MNRILFALLVVVLLLATVGGVNAQTITSLVDTSSAITSAQTTATSGLVLRGGIFLATVVISWIKAGRMSR